MSASEVSSPGKMVSTRGLKYKFAVGEKVLCYEPDLTKAKVLYDSKVLGIYETKDKRGRRLVQYKIHFQGWNPSWDRKVNSDFVLKDTAENRQLQRDLAEKAQLQLAAYLYRKERKKQRIRKTPSSNSETSPRLRDSSEENSSCSTIEQHERNFNMKDECDSESYSSSIESSHDEDRIAIVMGEKLKKYLEYDMEMICKQNRKHILPSRNPVVVNILENFVKQSAIKLALSFSQEGLPQNRRRNPQLRNPDKKEKEFDKLFNSISLLKEVADGLRVYFDFTLTDYLLYKNEKLQVLNLLSEENLKKFSYNAAPGLCLDFLTKSESDILNFTENIETNLNTEEPSKRKLRSYKSEDCSDISIENCLSRTSTTSSTGSVTPQPLMSANLDSTKSLPSLAFGIPPQIKEYLQKILTWSLIPSVTLPEPSMIFGATHLARLLVKLPDFLNASTSLSEERIKIVLQHLDSFATYLESHKEWFGDHNYFKEGD